MLSVDSIPTAQRAWIPASKARSIISAASTGFVGALPGGGITAPAHLPRSIAQVLGKWSSRSSRMRPARLRRRPSWETGLVDHQDPSGIAQAAVDVGKQVIPHSIRVPVGRRSADNATITHEELGLKLL